MSERSEQFVGGQILITLINEVISTVTEKTEEIQQEGVSTGSD